MQSLLAGQIFAEGQRNHRKGILIVGAHTHPLRAFVGQRPDIDIRAKRIPAHQLQGDLAQLLRRQRNDNPQNPAVLLPSLVVLPGAHAQTAPAAPRPSARESPQTRRCRNARHGSGCPRAPRASGTYCPPKYTIRFGSTSAFMALLSPAIPCKISRPRARARSSSATQRGFFTSRRSAASMLASGNTSGDLQQRAQHHHVARSRIAQFIGQCA